MKHIRYFMADPPDELVVTRAERRYPGARDGQLIGRDHAKLLQ